ncbi:hypothetical protein [Flavobacterium sp.]|uniref:hypothetical protein n=1 Tax=Flavobacterium sp. TaxID=239 RepID=UPI0026382871|nr:hypothetical protein [Flavobacterium sp.]
MKEEIISKYLERLKSANSASEINSILDEIIPILKASGISIGEIISYFRIHQRDYEIKSQDHQNSIANYNKSQDVIQLLMLKLNK